MATENVVPQTGQTVQTPRTAYFEIAEDQDGAWHWCLWGGNGRCMARNAVAYSRKKDAVQAIKILLKSAPTAKYIVKDNPV